MDTYARMGSPPTPDFSQRWSLRTLSVALLLATLIPLVVLIGAWVGWATRQERARTERDAREHAAIIAAEAGRLVASVQGTLIALAQSPAVQRPERAEAERLFRSLLKEAPLLADIGLLGREGTILAGAASPSPASPIFLADRDWFRAVIEFGRPAMGGYQVNWARGQAVAVLAHPVLDRDGRVMAVVMATLRLPAVSTEIAPAQTARWLQWAVVDEQGIVLLHREPWGALGKPLQPFPHAVKAVAVVPNTPWLAVAGIPETMVTEQLHGTLLQFWLPVLLLVTGAGGLAVWIARGAWVPARVLAAAVRKVGVGADADTIPVGGPREVAEVAATFRETLERLDRRQRELSALLKANRALSASLELDQALPAIVQEAAGIAGTPIVRLFLLEEASQVLRCRVGVGLPLEQERDLVVPVGISFSGEVAATRKPLAVADCRNDPRLLYPEHAMTYGLVSYLGLPVQQRDSLLGVLVFNTPAPRTYTGEEVAYLSVFADQVALAIQNAQAYSQARARAVQGSALFDVARTLLASRGVESIMSLILETARQRTRTDAAALAQPDPASGLLRMSHAAGVSEVHVREHAVAPGEGVAGRAFAEGRPAWTPDILYDPAIRLEEGARQRLRLEGQRAVLAVPLLLDGRAQGTLMVAAREPRQFQPDEVEALSALASLAAVAIENARLYGELQAELAQRQRVETDLRKIAHALEQSANLVVITDRDGGIEYMNPSFTRMTGYGAAELLGVNPRRLESGEMPAEASQRIRDAIAAAREWQGEMRLRRKDGGLFWVAGTVSPVRDESGAVTHFVGVGEDTTERRKAAEALAHRTQQLEAIRAVTAEITRELDLDRVLALIQRRAMELVGGTGGSLYLWDETTQSLVPRAWHGEAWIGEVRHRLGEGIIGTVAAERQGMVVADYASSPHAHPLFLERTRITAAMAEPLLYRDRLLGVIGVNNEGTDRRFTEEDRQLLTLFAAQAAIAIENARLFAELNLSYRELRQAQDELVRSEKLRALGQMAAGIAHDLNNVLAAILGQAQLLGMGAVDPAAQEGLTRLETAAMDGAQIVRRLQGFARQQPLEPLGPCDLGPVVRAAVELTRPSWRDEPQRRGISVEVHTDLPSLPPVLGQPAEIREALTNLILNAVDAMPRGGQLRISAQADGDWAVLTIADTGIGMSEEVRSRIFDPFFTTKGTQGTGLGLSVVYGIMERHGGRIEAASTPGRGATFSLRFRIAPAPAPVRASPGRPALLPRRLLLVDDDAMVRLTLANLLRSAGHTVIEAEDGSKGLARIADSPVDLVITDLGMPGVSGWDVARASREGRPGVPVVLLTGWGDQPGIEESRDRRLVDRILGKPVRLEDLLTVISDLTGRREPSHP